MITYGFVLKRMAAVSLVAATVWLISQIVEQMERPQVVAMPTRAATAPPALTFTPPTARANADRAGQCRALPELRSRRRTPQVDWLNAETPPRLADLRGRVVLLAFWGIDCAECLEVLPYVRQWDALYADQGLTVIGIHTPKFDHERSVAALRAELVRLDVTYPVAQDDQNAIWQSYGGRVRPTLLLIDKAGNLRYVRESASGYDETERAIQALLAEIHTP